MAGDKSFVHVGLIAIRHAFGHYCQSP